jgi:hypothetical protein
MHSNWVWIPPPLLVGICHGLSPMVNLLSSLLLLTNLQLIVIKSSMKSDAITQPFSFSLYTCYIWWLMHNSFFGLLTRLVVLLKNLSTPSFELQYFILLHIMYFVEGPSFSSCAYHIAILLWLIYPFIFMYIPLQGGKVPVAG